MKYTALIKALLYSLSLALVVLAALLVLSRRDLIGIRTLLSVLISVGVFAVSFSAFFFLLYPRDRRVARVLDSELSLDERVETMLEYKDKEGGIYELQREDTERVLSKIPTSRLKFPRLVSLVITLALSLTLFGTSFAIPALAEPTPDDEIVDGYEKNWRVASLRELISRVESNSYASDGVKADLVSVLEGLIELVISTDKDAVMRSGAVIAVGTVDGIRQKYVTAFRYAELFEDVKSGYFSGVAKALSELDDRDLAEALEDITGDFADPVDESVSVFLDLFMNVVNTVASENGQDELTKAFVGFSNALRTVMDSNGTKNDVEDAVYDLSNLLFDVMMSQQDDNSIIKVVRTGIIDIFELTDEDFAGSNITPPSESGDSELPGEGENKDEEDITPGAGYGKGDQLAGSNDTLYDHDSRDLVKLPEVVAKYYSKFDEIMDGMGEELKRAVEKYFELLKKPGTDN